MQRGLGGTVFEPVQPPERVDREFTLGPFTLTLIGCGLFTLCGLCFVFGYAVGHRNAESSSAVSVPPSIIQPVSAQSKPAAGQSGIASSSDTSITSETDAAGTAPGTAPGTDQADTLASGTAAATAGQPVVPVSSASTQPAVGQGNIMVQIAAVSHSEDADVLVSALRKRGYVVTARRDPTDGLLHVQVGPFATRTDAYTMRQKLLNDGYNAIVQQ